MSKMSNRKKFVLTLIVYSAAFAFLVFFLFVFMLVEGKDDYLIFRVFKGILRNSLIVAMILFFLWNCGIAVITLLYVKEKGMFVPESLRSPFDKGFKRRIIQRMLISVLLFTAGLLLFVVLAAKFVRLTVDYGTWLYYIFSLVRDNIVWIIALTWLIGFSFICYRFVSVLTGYLDQIVARTGDMLLDPSRPVVLSYRLKGIQDELNRIREQTLENARAARETEQKKNDLIVYLAHDLKTPLTSIIGYLTLMNDEPDISAETRAKYTGIALDKAQRLEELINEFFDVTRFNLTSMELQSERISLSRMLEQLADEFMPVFAEKGLSWQNEIDGGIEILCDPDKLERVFDNLIRNAVTYSYKNTAVMLSLRRNGDKAEITLKNHGKTIPPDKLERIFEQFYRADTSRTSSTGGAGLGLAIAKEIVRLHGGEISAESENESVCFTVLLPAVP